MKTTLTTAQVEEIKSSPRSTRWLALHYGVHVDVIRAAMRVKKGGAL